MTQPSAVEVNGALDAASVGRRQSDTAASLTVAYLINQYPKVSHSFIRREIAAIERCGVRVIRFSIRRSRDDFADEVDRSELRNTRAILDIGVLGMTVRFIAICLSRPFRFAQALVTALCLGWHSDRGLLRHLAYLGEACVLLDWLPEDVTHVHAHFATNSTMVAMLCHILGGPPYTFTAHGPDDFDRARVIGLNEKIVRARSVLTVSSFGKGQLYRWCEPSQWHKIHVLHPGLDDSFLLQPALPVPSIPRLVCIGRLAPDKGQLLLIAAVAELIAEGVPCELVLIGDGPMRAEIRARIEQLELGNRISVAGPLSSDELRRQIHQSRVVVVPSLAENLPSVILEAFALSRPVIATCVGGIAELVQPGVCGWLIPAGSVEALKKAIHEALEATPEVLGNMGRGGMLRVNERYRADDAAQRLRALFCG